MKRPLIASLVGGLILFIWQFLSFGPLNVHGAENTYTPNQEKIIAFLSENITEGGEYFLPTVPPGSSSEAMQKAQENAMGKPWAKINYRPAFEMNFGMNLFRGFAIDLLSVWLLVWLLMQMKNLSMKTALLSSLAVGAIGYMTIPYLNSVWYETNTFGYLADWVVQWGVVGAWLGWFLPEKE